MPEKDEKSIDDISIKEIMDFQIEKSNRIRIKELEQRLKTVENRAWDTWTHKTEKELRNMEQKIEKVEKLGIEYYDEKAFFSTHDKEIVQLKKQVEALEKDKNHFDREIEFIGNENLARKKQLSEIKNSVWFNYKQENGSEASIHIPNLYEREKQNRGVLRELIKMIVQYFGLILTPQQHKKVMSWYEKQLERLDGKDSNLTPENKVDEILGDPGELYDRKDGEISVSAGLDAKPGHVCHDASRTHTTDSKPESIVSESKCKCEHYSSEHEFGIGSCKKCNCKIFKLKIHEKPDEPNCYNYECDHYNERTIRCGLDSYYVEKCEKQEPTEDKDAHDFVAFLEQSNVSPKEVFEGIISEDIIGMITEKRAKQEPTEDIDLHERIMKSKLKPMKTVGWFKRKIAKHIPKWSLVEKADLEWYDLIIREALRTDDLEWKEWQKEGILKKLDKKKEKYLKEEK